jgi:hypothetical protein
LVTSTALPAVATNQKGERRRKARGKKKNQSSRSLASKQEYARANDKPTIVCGGLVHMKDAVILELKKVIAFRWQRIIKGDERGRGAVEFGVGSILWILGVLLV